MLDERAKKIIKNSTMWSMGMGAVPFPIFDLFLVSYVQTDMIKKLSYYYHKTFYDREVKAFILGLTTAATARVGSSLIKAIPGVGMVAGCASGGIISGASTYALGVVVAKYFQNNISIEDIDMDLAKEIYLEELENGKKFAEDLKNKFSNNPVDKAEKKKKRNVSRKEDKAKKIEEDARKEKDIYDRLTKLKSLHEKNIITHDEFEAKKDELLGEL